MDAEQIVREYFAGEKAEAFWILATGCVSLAAALVLWTWGREPFARGLAVGLLLVAGLGTTVGSTVYFRSDAQSQQLIELRRADPARFAAEEGPRIRQVVASFGYYRLGYAIAVLAALALVFLVGGAFPHGLAVGLLVLAATGLTVDFYAERRALTYVTALAAEGALPPHR
ncbi:MAG TPA: hypothetical protein VF851_04095 [Steroidobacteraceae bacterium]